VTPTKKVLLIGGTSHVGKTTLAGSCAERLAWRQISTDSLARHPGRPWRDDESDVPQDVRDHYARLNTAELVTSVRKHYLSNVMPIASALISSQLNNRFDPGLVLEGSALIPGAVAALNTERVASVWLTLDCELLIARIHEESRYNRRAAEERALIQKFCDRAVAYSQWLDGEISRYGFRAINADSEDLVSVLNAIV